MTYLIKHGADDYRVHLNDGTEPLSSGWSERPGANDIADQCAEEGSGASFLGDPEIRTVFIDAVAGGISYRDLTNDGETTPWY